ncbi:MAG: hypothetical protein WC044_01065 [Crocinitomicaceae bacterium]
MRFLGLAIVALSISFIGQAQSGKKKESTAKGTIFVYWGYNRTHYTKSNLRCVGPGYDFTLAGAKAIDRPEPLSAKMYLSLDHITVPQFNLRIGYYFKKNWAWSIGYDHFKYVFNDQNHVSLSGHIDPGVDTLSNWSGTYNGTPVITDYKNFHYENTNGMNYIRAELMRSFNLYKGGREGKFKVTGNLGLSTGIIMSVNDFNFAGTFDRVTYSISGFGVSASSGLRLEFFKHLFLQGNLNTGFVNQMHVRTRPNDPSSYAKQKLGFLEYNCVLGGLFYIKPKKKCDDCPSW